MDDYISLGPDETIREGDIFDTPNRTFVMPVIGSKASDYPNLRLKRPRSTVIRDAAIDYKNRNGEKQMSEHKHTPGPWATCNTTVYAVDDGEPVARCLDKEIHRAFSDAKIIAAAPELLAACELIKKWMLGGQPGPHSDSVVLDVIESAIMKAKGE